MYVCMYVVCMYTSRLCVCCVTSALIMYGYHFQCDGYEISRSVHFPNKSDGKAGNMAGFHPVLALLQRFHGGVAATHNLVI